MASSLASEQNHPTIQHFSRQNHSTKIKCNLSTYSYLCYDIYIYIYTYNAWTVFNCVVMVFRLQQLQQRKQRCLWKRQRPRSKSLCSLAMLAILSWFVSSLCFVCLRQGRRERVVCCPAVRSLYFHLLGPDIQKTVNISGKRGSPAKERGRQGTFLVGGPRLGLNIFVQRVRNAMESKL